MSKFTSPAIQAMNLVRYIGDEVSESGVPIQFLNCADIRKTIGAPSDDFAGQLVEDLNKRGTVKFVERSRERGVRAFSRYVES